MIPGDLCKHPLHDLFVRVRLGKGSHVLQVTGRESLHFGELMPQVFGQSVNYLCPPALLLLADQDVVANLPVEQQHLAVDGQGCSNLGCADAGFQVSQESLIVFGIEQSFGHEGSCSSFMLTGQAILIEQDTKRFIHASDMLRVTAICGIGLQLDWLQLR